MYVLMYDCDETPSSASNKSKISKHTEIQPSRQDDIGCYFLQDAIGSSGLLKLNYFHHEEKMLSRLNSSSNALIW